MQVEIILCGQSPLLMHNPQMVDPEFEVNRQIKALTKKRSKTDDDLRQIEQLEWIGGLYTGVVNGKACVTQPSSKVRKCLINTARISKLGKQVERGLIMTQLDVPLIYRGSESAKDLDSELTRLRADPTFKSRLSVGVNGKRIMRVRPQFGPWALIVEAVYVPDAGLNWDDLERTVSLAGVAERIGDNRVNGYGSFRGHVRVMEKGMKPVKPTVEGVAEFFDKLESKGVER